MPSGVPTDLAVQVAVLASEVQGLRRDLEEVKRLLERDVVEIRREVKALHDRKLLDEHGIRELCREVVSEETAVDTTARDNVMRLVQFSIAVGTVIFVLRGG